LNVLFFLERLEKKDLFFLREKKRERRNDGEGWVQCTSFEGGARRFVVKGSRVFLGQLYVYTYILIYDGCLL
jgi:hypothetical protein